MRRTALPCVSRAGSVMPKPRTNCRAKTNVTPEDRTPTVNRVRKAVRISPLSASVFCSPRRVPARGETACDRPINSEEAPTILRARLSSTKESSPN